MSEEEREKVREQRAASARRYRAKHPEKAKEARNRAAKGRDPAKQQAYNKRAAQKACDELGKAYVKKVLYQLSGHTIPHSAFPPELVRLKQGMMMLKRLAQEKGYGLIGRG